MKTIKYQLVRFDPVLDKNGDAKDWLFEIIIETPTLAGLKRYANWHRLDKTKHTVDEVYYEDGIMIDEKSLGTLIDIP